MTGCACKHPAALHAPRKHFGEAICLVPDCDCQGTHEDVTAANARRPVRLTSAVDLLLSKITPYVPDEWKARRLMAEILSEFTLEAK